MANKWGLFLGSIFFLHALTTTAQQPVNRRPSQTAAASPAPATIPTKNRVIKLNYQDELVGGSPENPDLMTINSKLPYTYKKMIRVRENFHKEMENGKSDFSAGD